MRAKALTLDLTQSLAERDRRRGGSRMVRGRRSDASGDLLVWASGPLRGRAGGRGSLLVHGVRTCRHLREKERDGTSWLMNGRNSAPSLSPLDRRMADSCLNRSPRMNLSGRLASQRLTGWWPRAWHVHNGMELGRDVERSIKKENAKTRSGREDQNKKQITKGRWRRGPRLKTERKREAWSALKTRVTNGSD